MTDWVEPSDDVDLGSWPVRLVPTPLPLRLAGATPDGARTVWLGNSRPGRGDTRAPYRRRSCPPPIRGLCVRLPGRQHADVIVGPAPDGSHPVVWAYVGREDDLHRHGDDRPPAGELLTRSNRCEAPIALIPLPDGGFHLAVDTREILTRIG